MPAFDPGQVGPAAGGGDGPGAVVGGPTQAAAVTARSVRLNILAAQNVRRAGLTRNAHGYGHRMSAETKKKSAVADEFEARAATFRRVAGDMKDPEDRAELLRIAAGYEQDAARLRKTLPPAGS